MSIRETEPGFPKLREPRVRRPRWLGLRQRSAKRARAQRELDAQKTALMERSGGVCEAMFSVHCTRVGVEPHHVVKQSQGGSHALSNLRWVCRWCNEAIEAYPAQARARGLVRSATGSWR